MSNNSASNDPGSRRLLPQSSQMSSFSFVQQPAYEQPREIQQKNYVFVDEHNRHKRLKVMRACEGCRRRKIRCDAATTNTWPCSACVRLKLNCVRPTGYDGSSDSQTYEGQAQPQQQSQTSQPQQPPPQSQPQLQQHALYNTAIDFQQHQLDQAASMDIGKASAAMYAPQAVAYPPGAPGSVPSGNLYGQVPFPDPQTANLHYTTVPPSMTSVDSAYASQQDIYSTPGLPPGSAESPPDSAYVTNDESVYSAGDLTNLLGSLRMNEAGTAPYLNNRSLASASANEHAPVGDDEEDYKSSLPPLISGPGMKIRIPPELMPDDATAQHYFDLYFANVHPYVPVLDRVTFFHQWRTNRSSISPLLIEAMLAIGGSLADDPAQGQQWLALATKHADSFLDVPRLSTLQALLVMLKAREAAPKRGYYYRSWMAIVQCVQMAKDLGLNEHYADHQAGLSCGDSPSDCLMKTRIWQTCFVCEVMIGSPQGRTDLSVMEDTVDLREPTPTPGIDESETQVSRSFVYLARVVANVSRMNLIYARIKRNKDWGADPEFTKMNPLLHQWPNELPPELTVTFPPDGSPPWLSSSFIGNMHSYHYLSILLLHRPQLQLLSPSSPDGRWKHHMVVCYSSAKLLCRLEEAILQSYGLHGLQNMQRGVNFTIYAVLTCVLIHLVALTSPDPDLNSDAREYFTRHMRILEKCMNAWPMPEMQKQVDAIREAFSADVRKPFVLKPSFPYGSPTPSSSSHTTPPHQSISLNTSPGGSAFRPEIPRTQSVEQVLQQQRRQQQQQIEAALSQSQVSGGFVSQSISPATAVATAAIKNIEPPLAGPALALITSVPNTQPTGVPQALPLGDASGWNPNRIFDQWNTTFGTPQVTQPSSQTSPLSATSSSGSVEIPTLQDIQAVHASLPQGLHPVSMPPYTAAPAPPPQSFITPAMWQESVASVYEGGLKRSWDYDSEAMPMLKR